MTRSSNTLVFWSSARRWRDVFLMKMYRAHPNDVDDMAKIWALTKFTAAQEVADAFFNAYPHAPDDPHLDTFVKGIAQRAGFDIT